MASPTNDAILGSFVSRGDDFLQLKNAGGTTLAGIDSTGTGYGALTTVNPSGALPVGSINFTPNQVGLPGFQVSAVTLSSAQILSLSGGTNTVTIVPAPPLGMVIIPSYWSVNFLAGNVAYVIGSSDCQFTVMFPTGSTNAALGVILTGSLDQTSNWVYSDSTSGMQTPSVDCINQPLVMQLSVGTVKTITSGNGTMVIKTWYSAIAAS